MRISVPNEQLLNVLWLVCVCLIIDQRSLKYIIERARCVSNGLAGLCAALSRTLADDIISWPHTQHWMVLACIYSSGANNELIQTTVPSQHAALFSKC